jgi:hypothetical protein
MQTHGTDAAAQKNAVLVSIKSAPGSPKVSALSGEKLCKESKYAPFSSDKGSVFKKAITNRPGPKLNGKNCQKKAAGLRAKNSPRSSLQKCTRQANNN